LEACFKNVLNQQCRTLIGSIAVMCDVTAMTNDASFDSFSEYSCEQQCKRASKRNAAAGLKNQPNYYGFTHQVDHATHTNYTH